MNIFKKALAVVSIALLNGLIGGSLIKIGWNLFIADALNVNHISLIVAIGIALIIHYFVDTIEVPNNDRGLTTYVIERTSTLALYSIMLSLILLVLSIFI